MIEMAIIVVAVILTAVVIVLLYRSRQVVKMHTSKVEEFKDAKLDLSKEVDK